MSNTKLQALVSRRAGVREALTLINNSPNLSHAKLIVQGFLAQIRAEYTKVQDIAPESMKKGPIATVADLQASLNQFDPSLNIRVVSPEIDEGIDAVTIRIDDDSQPVAVDINVG